MPRPAYGHRKDRRPDLKPVGCSVGGSGAGGLPLRMGIRDGHMRDSTEMPVAIEACLELGLEGMVAASKAYRRRTLGLCVEPSLGLVTLVPRTCGVRQELDAWGQSVERLVDVDYADGRVAQETMGFLVVHARQLAEPQARAYATAQAKEAEPVTDHIRRVAARSFAYLADAEAAIAPEEGRGPGSPGGKPKRWRDHALCYRVEAFRQRQKRTRRGRPPKAEPPQEETRYRLVVEAADPGTSSGRPGRPRTPG